MTTITRGEVTAVPGSGGAPDVAGVDMRTSNPKLLKRPELSYHLVYNLDLNAGKHVQRSGSVQYTISVPQTARRGRRLYLISPAGAQRTTATPRSLREAAVVVA